LKRAWRNEAGDAALVRRQKVRVARGAVHRNVAVVFAVVRAGAAVSASEAPPAPATPAAAAIAAARTAAKIVCPLRTATTLTPSPSSF
jgi:hypothetical protein